MRQPPARDIRPTPGPRGGQIAPFYAMEVLKAANRRQAEGHDVLHLELGEPGGPPPPQAVAAAAAALAVEPVRLGYTEALGSPSLRRRIAQHYRDSYGVAVDPARIAITTGSSAGFLLGFLAAFGDGARIGVSEPGYPAYRNIIAALGMTPVAVPTSHETRFQVTPALLTAAGRLDGLVIASPANPTGTMLTATEIAAIARWCAANGVRLVSDEVYHGITFGTAAATALAAAPDAIVVNSFSKYYAMTGWRVGWMIVPPDLVGAVERLSQNLYISAPTLSQIAAEAALGSTAFLDAKVAGYGRVRAQLLEILPQAGFDRLAPADGAFYIFADVSALTEDSTAFCARMLTETGVATTPGIDFDPARGKRFMRFAIAGPADHMVEAARRLRAWRR
ncbi:MAG: aminotransferase class I/II-fold pyridoxal phosphate-dependent enzyme [Alphaproteobacteria bacterium]|nr:aminotransferase class I/II-fold pyridoxal phosphate-dependent enzyme [Alphaproteobacteria bacterium]